MNPDRKFFSRIALGLIIYNLAGAGLQLSAIGLIKASGWDYTPYRIELNWLLNLVFMYLLALPAAALYYRHVPKFGQVRHERWEFKAWLAVFLIGLAMGYFGNILGSIMSAITGGASESYESLMDMIFDGNMLLTFINVVIGAPVVEELLFRKFLIDRTIGYGEKVSVFLSGTLFGLMHGNFQQFFYAFALGCLFAYIYCKTGRIQNTIFFHMWINFSGSILVPFLLRPVLSLDTEAGLAAAGQAKILLFALAVLGLLAYFLLQLAEAIAGLVLFFVFKKYICFYPGIRQLKGVREHLRIVVNPGMLVFIGLCIYEFF